jgi:hypothetical protein
MSAKQDTTESLTLVQGDPNAKDYDRSVDQSEDYDD